MDLEQFLALKDKKDKLQRDQDKASGALDQLVSQLEKDFNSKDIESAKELLLEIEHNLKASNLECAKALKEWEAEWEDKLEE